MRLKNLILLLVALAFVATLAACGSFGQSAGDQGNAQEQAPQETPDKQVAPKQAPQQSGETLNAVEPPKEEMFKLTVPKMERIKDDEVPTGPGTDEALFHDYAGVHLKNTGFPWEKEANIYIAGHRLGFENTESYLAFWDLNKLKAGDELYIVDSEGRKYTYEVFRKFVAAPTNVSVLAPIEGKNVVTLQTCTLPDYTSRLLVRAELKNIEEA